MRLTRSRFIKPAPIKRAHIKRAHIEQALGRFAYGALVALVGGFLGLAALPVQAAGPAPMAPGSAPPEIEAAIQPHRAFYEAKLERVSSSSEVIAVTGSMVFEWRDDCEGWGVDQAFLLGFSYVSGMTLDVRSSYNTWEAKDGSRYTAKIDRDTGGETTVYSIEATPNSAKFSGSEEAEFPLAPGTYFPTRHTLELLKMATTERRFLSVPVFDGSEIEPASQVSAVVGKARAGTPPVESDAMTETYRPIQLAFFKPDQQSPLPDFEMRLDLQPNGIARDLLIDYGDFVVGLKLRGLELLERSGC